jgi:hypothetical protein
VSVADSREELEAAVWQELTIAWQRCTSYIASGSTPLADPQGKGAVSRIMRAADAYARVTAGDEISAYETYGALKKEKP